MSNMAWFQVCCPECDAALQVKLPVGITSVECSQCEVIFSVKIQAAAMKDVVLESPSKRKRSRADSVRAAALKQLEERRAAAGRLPPVTVAYRLFLKLEMRRLYKEHPTWRHADVMRKAVSNWHASPMNPTNAPALPNANTAAGTSGGAGPSGVGGAIGSDAVDASAEHEAEHDTGEEGGWRGRGGCR